ncbi:MAG: hypothetical protein LUQ65_00290 [Candidatus Helarchaeota archaeon]|nr:hypothetical protein [Candidatus Helarchaeota archaeon]
MQGIMKNSPRKEKNWSKVKFKEPYARATERFRKEVITRSDFDPTTLFQFSIFMAKSLLQMLEDVEENFGPEGQKVCNEALIKVGRDMADQMFGGLPIPTGMSVIELVSFIATQINTVSWTSVEDPHIINDQKCEFDILWCPLEDEYAPFDCRIQRYLVQGIVNRVREMYPAADFDIEFKSTIPQGAKTCKFLIERKQKGVSDKWKLYSELLEKRALKRWKAKQESKKENK